MLTRAFGAMTLLAAFAPVFGQSVCVTPNCVFNGTPASCANRAAPRTANVLVGNGFSRVFLPANPKVEPGDCILWRLGEQSGPHTSSGSGCPTSTACSSPSPATCDWESGNLTGTSPTSSTCYYDPASFPAMTADSYYCRYHATPTSGSMRGTLMVTTPIVLTLGKDLATNSITLSWMGGGVPGDISYKVERQSAGDPTFPASPSTVAVDPDGGVFGTTYTEVGDLVSGTPRYYIVRNKQANE